MSDHWISHAIKAVKSRGKSKKYISTASGAKMIIQSRMGIIPQDKEHRWLAACGRQGVGRATLASRLNYVSRS
jgi:hypothetical protein